MKVFKTIRVRFALWTAGLLLVALILFGGFVYGRMSQNLASAVDDALKTVAAQVAAEVDVEDGTAVSVDDFLDDMQNMPVFEQGFSFRVYDTAGQIIEEYGPYQTLPSAYPSFSPPVQSGQFITFTDPATQHPVRFYIDPIVEENQTVGTVQVAQNLINSQQTLIQLLTTLLIGVPLVVVIAGMGGYILAARALAPIDKITRTARRISAEDLSARLNLNVTDDEIGRLADTFNSMLVRLDQAFQRERQFTADASHELRTPLTTMQTILSSTLAKSRTPAEYEHALADLFEETHHMSHLVEGLLHLARSDNSTSQTVYQPMDLSNLLYDVTESLRPLAEDKELTLNADIPDNLTIIGDSDALIRLFVNILGNAIKYTEQGQITVGAPFNPERLVEITITDTGVGIAPEHLPNIFDRFYRVDKSRSTSGAGLGLAIALNAARVHGGTISVESEVGRGTSFTIKLANYRGDHS